jgi:uncharacterized protein YwgA
MKEQTKRLITYLSMLNRSIDSSKFEDRVRVQKTAYILQEITEKLLYSDFSFYIRGPYSQQLAKEYFTFHDEFLHTKAEEKVSVAERAEIERIKPLLLELTATQLEIVASLLFLRKTRGEEEAERALHELKPYLKQEDIWGGSTIIKKLFLNDALKAKLMASMKAEAKEWDRISDESLKRF